MEIAIAACFPWPASTSSIGGMQMKVVPATMAKKTRIQMNMVVSFIGFSLIKIDLYKDLSSFGLFYPRKNRLPSRIPSRSSSP